jgi:hypothetical protein
MFDKENVMDIKVNLSAQAIKQLVVAFLHRFHIVIFVIVALGGLAVTILLLNNIVVLSSQSNGYTPDVNNATFDQATIKKIEDLQNRSQSPPTSGRTNPFVE